MKISKLFHWLYAVLMLLPLVMFLPSCLYYSLNKYATNETTTTINYKYESNVVNIKDDLIIGNIYHFNFNGGGDEFFYNECAFELLKVYQYNLVNCNPGVDYETWSSILEDSPISIKFESYGPDLLGGLAIKLNQDENLVYYNLNLDHALLLNAEIKLISIDKTYIDEQSLGTYFTYTDYNVIESVSVNTDDTISNKLYNAWESVWNLPLFVWTQNSFVSAPFTYITGLFGLQANNSLNYVFTYFCSISICWLVFDLLMYVPNLAHRWLDKGAIE